MGLNKAIEHGHEHRKEYRGAKAIDKTCRNHGSDDWALENRTYKNKKRIESANQKLEEYIEGELDDTSD